MKLDLKEMHIMLQEWDNAWVIVLVLISGFGCYMQSYLGDALGYSLLMMTYIHDFDQPVVMDFYGGSQSAIWKAFFISMIGNSQCK